MKIFELKVEGFDIIMLARALRLSTEYFQDVGQGDRHRRLVEMLDEIRISPDDLKK
jgi:hypothetical protein